MQTSIYILRKDCKLFTQNGKIYLEEGTLQREFPLENIRSINLFVQIDIPSSVFQVCLKNDISFYFASPFGDYLGKLQALQTKNVQVRLEQYKVCLDSQETLLKATDIILGKIKNSLSFLYRQRRFNSIDISSEIDSIFSFQNSINHISSLEQLRGYEGIVARYYFQALGKSLPEGFQFLERSRRPPKDKTNSLLSFGYTLLANNILTALETQGLDSSIGFLHSSLRNNPALVLDMMEEFRSIIVDHLVCSLLFSQSITHRDFDISGDFPLLTNEGRKKFIVAYESRLKKEITYEGKTMKFQRLFDYQADKMKHALLHKTSYTPFSFR